jgi:hypothetical protein
MITHAVWDGMVGLMEVQVKYRQPSWGRCGFLEGGRGSYFTEKFKLDI